MMLGRRVVGMYSDVYGRHGSVKIVLTVLSRGKLENRDVF